MIDGPGCLLAMDIPFQEAIENMAADGLPCMMDRDQLLKEFLGQFQYLKCVMVVLFCR